MVPSSLQARLYHLLLFPDGFDAHQKSKVVAGFPGYQSLPVCKDVGR